MRARALPARAWVSGNRRAGLATSAALLLMAGCGGSSRETVGEATPYLDPGFVEAGDYRLHYALTLARDLPSAIAGSYGILQRPNLAVLTVAIAPRDAAAGPAVAGAKVEATAVSLTGAREPLVLERRDEPGAATWIAAVEVRHRVPLTIEIEARAAPGGPLLRARLTREFRLE
jgi:Domain of unknown function (DUF4426)